MDVKAVLRIACSNKNYGSMQGNLIQGKAHLALKSKKKRFGDRSIHWVLLYSKQVKHR